MNTMYIQNTQYIAYIATSISITSRFIFMYLLYTRKSTNNLSLLFSVLSMASSSLWITYSQTILDLPLLIRSSSDLVMFTISCAYIVRNKCIEVNMVHPAIAEAVET